MQVGLEYSSDPILLPQRQKSNAFHTDMTAIFAWLKRTAANTHSLVYAP